MINEHIILKYINSIDKYKDFYIIDDSIEIIDNNIYFDFTNGVNNIYGHYMTMYLYKKLNYKERKMKLDSL
ncbi:hypothetical protein M0Q50_03260 [bacterium]|jgi:hypothetical protein|nr:hypothetical protein [bacterium]